MQKTILFKNGKVNFSDTGKGRTVVLLHGFLGSHKIWENTILNLSKSYRVIAIDLPGHGATECFGYIHTMELMAKSVKAVMDKLRLKKYVIIGHSMGGYVSLAFAELYPDMMKGLALVNSTSRADSDERKANRDRAIKAVKQNKEIFVRMSVGNLFSEENRERLVEEIEQTKLEALKTPVQGIVAALEGMKVRNDREVILHFAPYPILLILGKKDPVLVYEDNVEQVENTSVKLISYDGGHMSHIENCEELVKDLFEFFKSC